jgi:hypothetical protein
VVFHASEFISCARAAIPRRWTSYDVAEYFAPVRYLEVTDDVPRTLIDARLAQFADACAREVPWTCDVRRRYAAVFLLAKIHSSLEGLEAPVARRTARMFDMVERSLQSAAPVKT